MQDLINTAQRLQARCEAEGWRFCFIGGLAVQRWGEPRVTRDVDLSIYTGLDDEKEVIQRLIETYSPRIENAGAFAETHRVLLIQDDAAGVGIDVSLAVLDFESRVIDRSSQFEFLEGVHLRTCSAEDLIVYKVFANRDRDWLDVEGILTRQHGQLDIPLIERELFPLIEIKEEPQILERWERKRREMT